MAQAGSHWPEVSQSFESAPNDHSFYSPSYAVNASYTSRESLDISPEQAQVNSFSPYPLNAPPPHRAGEPNHHLGSTNLTPAHLAPPRVGNAQSTRSPIDRMNEDPGPWVRLGDAPTQAQGPLFRTHTQSVVRQPPPSQYTGFRSQAPSNPESSHVTDGHGPGGGGLNGSVHHDSGYGTNVNNVPGTTSVHSGHMEFVGDTIDSTLDDGNNFITDMGTINLQPPGAPPMGPPPYAVMHEQPAVIGEYQEPRSEHDEMLGDLVCPRPACASMQFKTQSELTKHQQRHQKVHRCDVPDCTRKDGFSTKNDLDRHKKSKHNIRPPNGNDRSYRCAGHNCPKRIKTWPRLDNFKAHCARIHRTENLDDLIKRSEIFQASPSPPADYPVPRNGGTRHPFESPLGSRTDPQIHQNTLLADLSQPSQIAHYQQDHPPFSAAASGHRAEQIIVDAGSHSTHDIVQERPTRIPRPISLQEDHRTRASAHINSPSHTQPLATAPIDRSLDVDVDEPQGGAPFVLSQPPGAKKRKLSTGASLTTSEQVDEASKSILAEIRRGETSPESLQTTIAREMQKFLDVAMQQVAGEAEDATDGGEPASKQKRLECRICGKTVDRKCDLKKHEKRHSRPWGCTNETCRRTFGSKNDWKRHENSQHHQLETWRCCEPSKTSRINECARLFFRRDPFQAHLRRDHKLLDEEYVRAQCRQRRVGRNFQNGFWCGFCRAIVKLHAHGLEAWDERFNHIDDCHFKRGRCIDEWYPMGRDVPKGRLLRAADDPAGGDGGSPSTAFDAESASDSSDFDANDARRQRAARARRTRGAGVAEPLDAIPQPEIPEEEPAAPQPRPRRSQGRPCKSCGQGWISNFKQTCDFCCR